MFLTSAWSGSPSIVDNAILTEVFSVLIDGGPGVALSQTNLCNKRPFPVKSFPTSMRTGVQL